MEELIGYIVESLTGNSDFDIAISEKDRLITITLSPDDIGRVIGLGGKTAKAIRLIVKWMFPLKGKHYDGEWYTNKPDYDNLPKAMNDIMTKLGYWKDDCIIASGITEKFWSATPGIYVRIEELKPNIKKTGCYDCVYADWDADGCTCKLDGFFICDPRTGCECRTRKERYDDERKVDDQAV